MITVNRLQWTLIHCVWLPCAFEEFGRLTNSLLHFGFTQIVHMQLAKHWNLRKYIQNTIYIYIKALMRVCVCKPTQPADSCGDWRACASVLQHFHADACSLRTFCVWAATFCHQQLRPKPASVQQHRCHWYSLVSHCRSIPYASCQTLMYGRAANC